LVRLLDIFPPELGGWLAWCKLLDGLRLRHFLRKIKL
jgi:hypothetical protein